MMEYPSCTRLTDSGQVRADRISPVADLISPGGHQFDTFVLNLSKVSDTRYGSRQSRYGSQQVFGILLVIYSFQMEAVAEHIGLESGFPCFYFFPAEARVGQVSQLVTRIDDSRFAEYGSESILQQRFCRISPIHILVT